MSATANKAEAGLSNKERVFAILRASSGNLLEWAGFWFYAYTMIYFTPAFFPAGNPTVQLLQSAIIFGVPFLARPFAGWYYGQLADRKGQRTALIHSGSMMFIGSLLLTLSPTYAQVGYLAPVLLVCARLFHGLAVGGGYGTNASYMSEVAIKNQRGFLASFQYTTLIGGQLLALATVLVLESLLSKAQLFAWGWRIPFALGTLGALISIGLRMSLQETSSKKPNAVKQAGSLKHLFRYKRELVTIFVTTAAGSACFYTFTVYMQKYLVNSLGIPSSSANTLLAFALLVTMFLQPLFGALSDRMGRLMSMLLFSGLMAILPLPIAYYLSNTTNLYLIFGVITLTLTVLSLYTSIAGIIKAELFPSEIRALGVGLSYAVANAVFGGSVESIAFWTKSIGIEFAFFGYLMFLSLGSFIVCLLYLPASLKMNYLENGSSSEPVIQPAINTIAPTEIKESLPKRPIHHAAQKTTNKKRPKNTNPSKA
jgi:MFS family permease